MQRLALIQLISEQTIPNLLPLCALQPSFLFHLTTARTSVRSLQIRRAVRQSGIDAHFENVRLSDMPGIAESARAVERCVEQSVQAGLRPVLNFTGGTKLMSIGAYQQAAALHLSSFYVDTHSGCFVDGGTGEGIAHLFGNNFAFAPFLDALSLDMMVVANGNQSVSEGSDWRPHLGAARALHAHPAELETVRQSLHGASGPVPFDAEPRTPAAWLEALGKPFTVPSPLFQPLMEAGLLDPSSRPERALLPAASAADIRLLVEEKEHSYIENYNERAFSAMRPLQIVRNFFGGGWWEVVVIDAMDRCGRFRDLRWSADIIQQGGALLEEDILAMHGADAVCVSCKTQAGRTRLLPYLEELSSRSKAIGGSFTHAFLALRKAPSDYQRRQVASRARELRIQILTPESLECPGAFNSF